MTKRKEPIRLVASQRTQAAEMLARAFLVDPAYTALFPDSTERERSLRRLFGAVVGYSLVHTAPALADPG